MFDYLWPGFLFSDSGRNNCIPGSVTALEPLAGMTALGRREARRMGRGSMGLLLPAIQTWQEEHSHREGRRESLLFEVWN